MPFILRRSGEDPKWSTWKKAPNFFGDYSPENEHDWRLENPPCSLWSTSSNGGCFQCHVSFLGRIFLVIFFEETEDDTMFCCCKTNVFFDFSVGWWALQCAQRSCQILGVSCGFGIQTTKKQLAFQKREKKTSWKRKSMVFLCFHFPHPPSQKRCKTFFQVVLFLCHIYWFCWSSTWWGGTFMGFRRGFPPGMVFFGNPLM